jgi:hypothetical protein
MRRSPLRRLTALKRTAMKPWRRKAEDKVPDWLFGYLLGRDRTCVPARYGAPDACSGRLTIEHVKTESMTGKRAPSDPAHTVLACLHHNLTWCLTTAAKDAERAYLARVEGGEEWAA